MIFGAKKQGLVEGLCVGSNQVEVSHMQFAVDILIFCPPKKVLVDYRRLLDYFSLTSKLKINYQKTAFIPIHCNEEWINKAKDFLQCVVLSLPIKYLRIPLGANPRHEKT